MSKLNLSIRGKSMWQQHEKKIAQERQRIVDKFKISVEQYLILDHLSKNGSLTVDYLSEVTGQHKVDIEINIESLKGKGLMV